MRPYRTHKINFKQDYPCPCCRRGLLQPITLTEAMGCDRCQQIFVVKENSQIIEQLSSLYQRKAWRWTGYRWANITSGLTPNSLSALLITIVLFPIVMAIALPLLLQRFSTPSMMLGVIVCFVLITFVGLVLWLAYRQ